jgi:hypothetical protein
LLLLKAVLPKTPADAVEAVHEMAPDVDLKATQGWSDSKSQ